MGPHNRHTNRYPGWQRWIERKALPGVARLMPTQPLTYSRYVRAKGVYMLRLILKGWIIDVLLIAVGIISAGFGLKGFLLPNGFLDGGATGISLLINNLLGIPLALLLIVVNLPFIFMGYRVIGGEFAIKAIVTIVGLAACVAFLPYPEVTEDKLLISVFGGFFLGTGIGLAVRGGAVIDGTEILAIFLSRRFGISIGDVIMIVNVIIFAFAAYLLSVETALYAMLTYLAASKTVDFILEGIEEYTGVTIISTKSDAIRDMITQDLHQGLTVYRGERGYGKRGHLKENVNIIYTVVTRLEVNRMRASVQRIDPEAFIIMSGLKDTIGGMTKKRRHKH